MAAPLLEELGALGRALAAGSVPLELALLAGCLLLAWAAARLMAGRVRDGDGGASVLFGERVLDGALFPLLALGLALLVRHLLLEESATGLMRLAIPVLLSLALIRLAVRVLRLAFPHSQLVRIAERWLSWAVWLGLILWLTGVLPVALAGLEAVSWTVGATRLSLRALLEGVFNAIVVLMLALWLSAVIETRLLHGVVANTSLRKIAANATRVLLLFVGLLLALSAAGIDLTALSVFGGAIGVGLGFGLQKLASNYVSGFVILAERSLRIGDLVRVDQFEGRITDINTRATIIRAANGRESIVPNEMLITQRVENAAGADASLALTSVLRIAHGSDVAALLPRLEAALQRVPRVMQDAAHAPAVYLSNVLPEGLELTATYAIADPLNGQLNLRSAVNLALLAVLADAGVEVR